VTTLDPSESADATITGTSPAQVLNLDIPRGYTGATTIGDSGMAFETRAAIAGATIEAVRKYSYTAGYAAFGDGGHGLYKRLASHPYPLWVTGTNYMFATKFVRNSAGNFYRLVRDPGGASSTVEPVHATVGQEVQGADGYKWRREDANKGWVRSVDRYKADGTTDATDGGWWGLVPEGGAVRLDNFGGQADANTAGVGGTDNWQALTDALHYTSWSFITAPYSYKILLPAGNMRFSAGFDIHVITCISGVWGTGQYQGGSVLHFPNTVDPFIFGNNATEGATSLTTGLGESAGSILENVSIWGGGGLGIFTDANRTMIRIRTQVTIRNYSLYGIPGRGVYIIGGGGDGNANNWISEAAYIHEAGSDYFKVQGSDANGGRCVGLVTQGEGGRGGCAIIETGGLGCNLYTGLQITGYGNTGVRHGGNAYQLISGVSGIGAATTPGTNDEIWMYLWPITTESLIQFPNWSALDTYTLQCPAFFEGGQSIVIPTYVEGSTISAHVTGGAQVIGGNMACTRYSNKMGQVDIGVNSKLANSQAFGTRRLHAPGSAEEVAQGDSSEVYVGGPAESGGYANGMNWLQVRRELTGTGWYEWGYRGADIYFGLAGTADFWRISGTTTARTYGRSAAVPHIFGFHDFAIHDASDPAFARIYGMRAARPNSGSHARGEWVWPQNPTTYGTAAWVCSVDGTPGTWATVPLFGLTSIDPPYNGDLVVECTSNTQLKFKYRGSDGTVRSASLTLS
jgi:hypothetical protein